MSDDAARPHTFEPDTFEPDTVEPDTVEPGVADPGERAARSGQELVEVVDETGAVVEVTSRRAVRQGNLRHRCTYIVVLDASHRVVVHQRAWWKDVYPGYWDLCFGGVCGVGEEWEPAAARELAEEAGIVGVALEPLGPVRYDEADGRIVARVYLARHDGPLSCPDGEVVAVDRVPAVDFGAWLTGHQVCPDSLALVVPLLAPRLVAS